MCCTQRATRLPFQDFILKKNGIKGETDFVKYCTYSENKVNNKTYIKKKKTHPVYE